MSMLQKSYPTSESRTDCPARVHGSRYAYMTYRCRCADAQRAYDDYEQARKEARRTSPPARVDATGTFRRLRTLMAIGYTTADLAHRLGYHSGRINWYERRYLTLTPRIATRVAVLYTELADTTGPSRENRSNAHTYGWYFPEDWEGHDMDDPTDHPGRVETAAHTPRPVAVPAREVTWWDASCRDEGYDPDWWHADEGRLTRKAAAICRSCPLQRACLRRALVKNERYGVWGGLTDEQRIRVHKRLVQRVGSTNLAGTAELDQALNAYTGTTTTPTPTAESTPVAA